MSMSGLVRDWLRTKEIEEAAIRDRRAAEDRMLKGFDIPETLEGTASRNIGEYEIKITGRMNRKVDSEKLLELAAEAGLSDHLTSLFRWKPEVNISVWKAAAPSITAPLTGAITTTAGRPSFKIERK